MTELQNCKFRTNFINWDTSQKKHYGRKTNKSVDAYKMLEIT
jgi:hypothetical protein